ncbi:LytTR family DNA-binding domain-containing protein [Microbulbifer hydrolyticus]|uniref:HTH LytTR-type domain-containing protein n=1 Tax=Microbulbifer hydrolyticus TaxID=48074 RepID=A0A6P1TC97_9GAMM|nr:LytTR family DNA-binding domain-containing protein [Microbulbifer hydrolyticus]MBB5213054.1 hypothetical protein [Microbulbifer hydrolyticus]QHQ40414.1 hypothetical protein GTQ55_16490 [Microbulbifer hydrolyticus]
MTALSQIWKGWLSPYTRMGVIWVAFFLLYNLYCYFWRHYIGGARYDFIDSQIFWVKEWGVLLSLSAVGMAMKVQCQRSISAAQAVVAFVVVYLFSSVTRVLIDYDFFGHNWGASLVGMAPKYLLAAALVCVGLWISMRPVRETRPVSPAGDAASDAASDVLEVEHRGLTRPLPLAHIHYVRAAGNYVEIHADGKYYMKRSTIKQLAESLPDTRFMRVHRSFIVNLDRVEHLCNAENGAAYLLLVGQEKVTVSKGYKGAVKARLSARSIHP